jgi:hypothetical protein
VIQRVRGAPSETFRDHSHLARFPGIGLPRRLARRQLAVHAMGRRMGVSSQTPASRPRFNQSANSEQAKANK